MEYEQLEKCNKVVHQTILSQDVGSFYNMLHPEAILVTHFPYPDTQSGTSSETAATAIISPAVGIMWAEQLGKRTPKQRRAQLLREQAAVRERQTKRYEDHLKARTTAAMGNRNHNRSSSNNNNDNDNAADDTSASTSLMAAADTTIATPATEVSAPAATEAPFIKAGPKIGTAKKTTGAAVTRSSSSSNRAAPSAVAAALGSKREHGGLTFYFNQPAPLESMQLGPVGGTTDPWGRAAGTNSSNNSSDTNKAKAGEKAAFSAMNGCVPVSTATPAAGAATTPATSAASGGGVPRDPKLEAAVAAEYGDYVDVAEGPMLICERLCLLLSWVNQDEYLADIDAQLDPRKSILQDAEVLPPPPVPRTPQETYAQLGRQHTDRNQLVSRLTVTWGRERLLFCDQLHLDDGLIVCIHRRMLTLPEMLPIFPTNGQQWMAAQKADSIRDELKDFYGVTRSRVAAVSHALPLLDFSFLTIGSDIALLLNAQTVPAGGRKHQCKSERPAVDPRLAQGVFLTANNDPSCTTKTGRTLIKAKNKRGDEEAYEFATGERQRYQVFDGTMGGDGDGDVDSLLLLGGASIAGGGGGGTGARGSVAAMIAAANEGRRHFKYDATSLRIASCQLCLPTAAQQLQQGSSRGGNNSSDVAIMAAGGSGKNGGSGAAGRRPLQFLTVVQGLVANAAITLHSLDLSDNKLSTLPDLSRLPLQRLLLHGNCIDDWEEVEEHVCSLPYLSAVTLYGNPIADNDANYWVQALSRLLHHPERKVKLKQLDFVTLTAQDLNQMGVRKR